ncbi:hypothetical protein [Marinilactibacillus sp. Marseille-P9653]|uniref:hypothetical protein n=1 Tax=Marinilactibacillus sp. Marseille-P9653 TaxID=2866583 RepID=UPI001CE46A88|nr:hypothetical protein [Marinilactibacillus sp. Marseille-P9653]
MKLLMALFGLIVLSGCAGNEEGEFLYSFNQIDHSKIVTDTVIENCLDVSIKEDGMVLKEEELDEFLLNIKITNQSSEELVVGSEWSLEKYRLLSDI